MTAIVSTAAAALAPSSVWHLAGDVLVRFPRALPRFLPAALLFAAPLAFLQRDRRFLGIEVPVLGAGVLERAIDFAMQQIALATLVLIFVGEMRGERVSLWAGLSKALRRIVPLVVAGCAYYLLGFIGMLALIVPGILAMTSFALVLPLVAIEGRGVVDAFGRSDRLTSGSYGAALVAFLPLLATSYLCFGASLQVLMRVLGPGWTLISIAGVAGIAILLLFQAVLIGVLYVRLAALEDLRARMG